MMPEKRIRTALIDDDRVFATALAGRLSDQPDLQVVGTAGSSVGAVELISHNEVDVVALDRTSLVRTGLRSGGSYFQRWPGLWLVVTAAAADPIRVAEAARRLVRQTPLRVRPQEGFITRHLLVRSAQLMRSRARSIGNDGGRK